MKKIMIILVAVTMGIPNIQALTLLPPPSLEKVLPVDPKIDVRKAVSDKAWAAQSEQGIDVHEELRDQFDALKKSLEEKKPSVVKDVLMVEQDVVTQAENDTDQYALPVVKEPRRPQAPAGFDPHQQSREEMEGLKRALENKPAVE